MQIDKPTPAEFAEFLDLVDAEIRPLRAKTHAWDDFPLILHEENRPWTLVARGTDGMVIGGIASLIRSFTTNYTDIGVAGIGSVVTHPGHRGQGISRSLQDAMLEMCRRQGVPLAVLWTDHPEIYAGRGFFPAGWEFHLDFSEAELPGLAEPDLTVRSLSVLDIEIVEAMYQNHPCRTLRNPGDSEQLYLMPGTKGLVLERGSLDSGGEILAAVFCGKGADFPDYVTEYEGEERGALALLGHIRHAGLARHILVPAGEEAFAEKLVKLGAGWEIRSSGLWKVLAPEALITTTGIGADQPEHIVGDPRFWLGGVDEDGALQPGILKLGVWGFDSV